MAEPTHGLNAESVTELASRRADPGTMAHADKRFVYDRLANRESVNQECGKYVRGEAHTSGIEGFWSMIKRSVTGAYPCWSKKHIHRYINELASRHNLCMADRVGQIELTILGMTGKRLRHKDMISDDGLPSGHGRRSAMSKEEQSDYLNWLLLEERCSDQALQNESMPLQGGAPSHYIRRGQSTGTGQMRRQRQGSHSTWASRYVMSSLRLVIFRASAAEISTLNSLLMRLRNATPARELIPQS